MNILITGAAGYIGSHIALNLIEQNKKIFLIDNLENSSINNINVLRKLYKKKINFTKLDVRDEKKLSIYLKRNKITDIIHLAGLKSVEESEIYPEKYYENNIQSLTNVLKLCEEKNISNIVFSSSCTVYGNPEFIPVTESTPIGKAQSPYAKTKIFSEDILKDFYKTSSKSICNLRYFNPIGAHESGLLGDYPNGKPNNLLPFVTQVAAGIREKLSVFGDDYDTADGSCIRDYIHVVDLAKAHVNAIDFNRNNNHSYSVFNIGTGVGITVLELLKTFEKINNTKVNFEITQRREGDVGAIYANCAHAEKNLNWKAELNLEDMLSSAWKFQKNHF